MRITSISPIRSKILLRVHNIQVLVHRQKSPLLIRHRQRHHVDSPIRELQKVHTWRDQFLIRAGVVAFILVVLMRVDLVAVDIEGTFQAEKSRSFLDV